MPRGIQITVAHRKYTRVADVLQSHLFTHVQSAYDGETITVTAAAATAMATRETRYVFGKPTPYSAYASMIQNYTVRDYAVKFAEIMTASMVYIKRERKLFTGDMDARAANSSTPRHMMFAVGTNAANVLTYCNGSGGRKGWGNCRCR